MYIALSRHYVMIDVVATRNIIITCSPNKAEVGTKNLVSSYNPRLPVKQVAGMIVII